MAIDDEYLKFQHSLVLWERWAGPLYTVMTRAEIQPNAFWASGHLWGTGWPHGPHWHHPPSQPLGGEQAVYFCSTKGETQGQGGKVPSQNDTVSHELSSAFSIPGLAFSYSSEFLIGSPSLGNSSPQYFGGHFGKKSWVPDL